MKSDLERDLSGVKNDMARKDDLSGAKNDMARLEQNIMERSKQFYNPYTSGLFNKPAGSGQLNINAQTYDLSSTYELKKPLNYMFSFATLFLHILLTNINCQENSKNCCLPEIIMLNFIFILG